MDDTDKTTGERWLAEFYPVPASDTEGLTDVEVVERDIRLWSGATKENLQRYGLSYANHSIVGDGWAFRLTRLRSAICRHFYTDARHDCLDCPLSTWAAGAPLRGLAVNCCNHIYSAAANNPGRMLLALLCTHAMLREDAEEQAMEEVTT